MKKLSFLSILITISNILLSQTVTIDGNAFLENQANHDSIKIVFERTAPSSLFDSVYTSSSGYYTIDLETGVYDITYSKTGFFYINVNDQAFYSNISLADTILLEHTTLIDVPDDFVSIQEAIEQALSGDTVLVDTGTYYENINFLGKDITVASLFLTTGDTSYISQTVIDGGQNGSVVTFENFEDSTSILSGYTITNGESGNSNGGGIYCFGSPKIVNLIISNNSATSSSSGGGGICCQSGNPIFRNIIVINNSAYGHGGGIFCVSDSPIFEEVIVSGNYTTNGNGGGIYINNGHPKFINVDVYNNSSNGNGGGIFSNHNTYFNKVKIYENHANSGGGIFCHVNGILHINNIQIFKNTSNNNSGGIYISGGNSHSINNSVISNNHGTGIQCSSGLLNLNITNSIITENYSGYGVSGTSGTEDIINVKYSNIYNNEYGNFNYCNQWTGVNVAINANGDSVDAYNNIQLEPMFADTANGDYHLLEGSPCIDAGINDSVTTQTDYDGNFRIWDGDNNGSFIVDMGAFEFGAPVSSSFNCGDSFIDSRDGKEYSTVLIGNQCWMAENLNVGTMIESNSNADNQTDNDALEKYCYGNNSANCEIYGGLYQWDEMMQYYLSDAGDTGTTQGVCPTGWHIPTDSEWTILTDYLGGENIAGGKMKETGTLHWTSPNTSATNESGFTALPGGYRVLPTGAFNSINDYTYFWSATEYNSTDAWYRGVFYNSAIVHRDSTIKSLGFSVRCIKDISTFDTLSILNFDYNEILCYGDTTTLSVIVEGGIFPYTYEWNTGCTDDTCIVFAGIYVVTVIDDLGNSTIDSVEIIQPDSLQAIIASTDVSCYDDNDGAIEVEFSGGIQPYTYIWTNGNTNASINGLLAGDYYITIIDANDCKLVDTVHIIEPDQLILQLDITNANCNEPNGSAIVNVNGGILSYTYLWSCGDTTAIADSLYSGLYMINVIDANNCSEMAAATISDTDGSVMTIDSVHNVTCNGGSDGFIDITVTGGTEPYLFEWSNGHTDEDISGLAAGPYEINVTDNNSCIVVESIIIAQPSALELLLSITDANCGNSDGSVAITVSGGVSPYTYLWSTGNTNTTEENLIAGIYSITVTDDNDCTDALSFSINNTDGPVITVDSIIDVYCGDINGAIFISVSGGAAPYSYLWSDGSTTVDLTGVTSGQYNLTVTDDVGCIATAISIIPEILPLKNPICVVTVDSALGKNLIVWEKVQETGIESYNIYKESTQAGIYYQVGNISADSITVFADPLSNPRIRSWRYKISAMDSCGNESELSELHKTIHLTINDGIGFSYNLIWNDYEGFDYSTYYIYRYTFFNGWELIDSLPSNLNSYTDYPPFGTFYYKIGINTPDICAPLGKDLSGPYSQSLSNLDDDYLVNIFQDNNSSNNLLIYPNPFINTTRIEFPNPDNLSYQLIITDITGKVVRIISNINDNNIEIEKGNLTRGFYIVELKGEKIYRGRILIR